ncbi:MAG: hypothetical protein FWD69_11585 [Polyangiaceae bacterium]|nr:hypothetical protein [Polyangiaceae bacterium]
MLTSLRFIVGVALCALVVGAGCSKRSEPEPSAKIVTLPAPSAADSAVESPSVREGCVRTGALDLAEKDVTCILSHPPSEIVHDLARALEITLAADPPEVPQGGTTLLRLAVANGTRREILVPFEVAAPGSLAHPDWSRLAGGPELRGDPTTGSRIVFPLVTLDTHERSVDALPMLAPSALPSPARIVAVRVPPGGKLTHVVSFWAMRIPAPAPAYRDSADHLIVPKTFPVPLVPGEYIARLEVPIVGLLPIERQVSANVRVIDARDQ